MTSPKKKPATKQEKRCGADDVRANDAQLKHFDRIRGLVAEADKKDVACRFKVAVECRKVRDNTRYGAHAVPQLASHLGWSVSKVRDYAAVATVWPTKDKFAKVTAKPNKHGMPLSWYHLVELTRENDGNRRRSFMTRALNEAWSVSELAAKRMGKSSKSDDEADSADTKSKAPPSLARAVESAVMQLDDWKETWTKRLPKTIEKADPGELNDALTRLEQVHQVTGLWVKQVKDRLELEAAKQKERKQTKGKRSKGKADRGAPRGKTRMPRRVSADDDPI